MTIGAGIFLTALGAILRYAVNDPVEAINIPTVGTILMVAGVVGVVAGLALAMTDRDRGRIVERERVVDRERDPYDRPPRDRY